MSDAMRELEIQYENGRQLLQKLARGCAFEAESVLDGSHKGIKLEDARRLFSVFPDLKGTDLDAMLVVPDETGMMVPILALPGVKYAPELYRFPPCEEKEVARTVHVILVMVYAVVLDNRRRTKVDPTAVFVLPTGRQVELTHRYIEALAVRNKWTKETPEERKQGLLRRIVQLDEKLQVVPEDQSEDWQTLRGLIAWILFTGGPNYAAEI